MADQTTDDNQPRGPVVLVTGGAGFLGKALVHELLKPDAVLAPAELRVLDLQPAAAPDGDSRLRSSVADIRDYPAVLSACRGADLVFHSAALVDWGRFPEQEVASVNVGGTRNVIRACREAGVPALVATSTLDVVYTGQPILDGDETLPHAPQHENAYCRSKARAELEVLQANGTPLDNGAGRLRTTVIRPMSIFGEGDPFHVTGLLDTAVLGVVARLGDGRSRSQHVYVRNAAHGHVLAGRSLLSPESPAPGQVYFITDFPPQNFFDYLQPIIEGAGYRMLPRSLALPRWLMMGLALGLKRASTLLRPLVSFTPTLTPFAVNFVCLDFTFRGHKAARELGYQPAYSEQEAFERTIAYFRKS